MRGSTESQSQWQIELTFFISVRSVFIFQVVDLLLPWNHLSSHKIEVTLNVSVLISWFVVCTVADWRDSSCPPPWSGICSAPRQALGSPCTREWPPGHQVAPIWLDDFLSPLSGYFLLKTHDSSQKTATLRKSFLEPFPFPLTAPEIRLPSGFSQNMHGKPPDQPPLILHGFFECMS